MSSKMNNIVNMFVNSMKNSNDKKSSFDTTAEVKRVENGIAYVHFNGGANETPVKLTMDAKPGDVVKVRVSGKRAFLQGNSTAPPTDDTTAIRAANRAISAQETADTAKNTAEEAQEEAKGAFVMAETAKKVADDTEQHFWFTETGTDTGAHITEKTQEDFLDDPTNGGGNLLARSNGLAVRQGMTELASFSANGSQIGLSSGAHSVADANGQRFYGSNGTTQLANIGYGEGRDETGQTAIAPYYSFGLREGNTASFIGNYSVAEGYGVLAKGYCSHAEGYGANDPTTAEGYVSHAEGFQTWAEGEMSHAEGNRTHAKGHMSHAQGNGTTAYNPYETVIGTVNEQETVSSINPYKKGDFAFVIGNGTYATPSNAFTVAWTGDVEAAGDITDGNGNVLSDKADTSAIPTATSDLTNDSGFVTSSDLLPLFKTVTVTATVSNITANSSKNASFAPAAQTGYTRVGIVGWNTANIHVFIATCTGTTLTFANASSSTQTCTNAQVTWLFIRSSL